MLEKAIAGHDQCIAGLKQALAVVGDVEAQMVAALQEANQTMRAQPRGEKAQPVQAPIPAPPSKAKRGRPPGRPAKGRKPQVMHDEVTVAGGGGMTPEQAAAE